MSMSPLPKRLNSASIMGPAGRSVADAVFLEATPASTVLTLIGQGLLGLDDAWETVRVDDANAPLPRVLAWARGGGAGGACRTLPDDQGWAALAGGAQGVAKFTDTDRLLAWAFSDARAWDPLAGQDPAGAGGQWAVDWAVEKSRAWVVDAALRQPGRPSIPRQWFVHSMVRAFSRGGLGTLRVLAAHAQLDINGVRAAAIAGKSGKGSLRADSSGLPLLHLARRAEEVDVLLELGADPTARDGHGRRADEYWDSAEGRAAGLGADLARRSSLLAQEAGRRDPDLALAAHFHNFHMADTKAFGAWLARQPRDMVVGPERQVPVQALWQGPAEHEDKIKRAEMLVAHLDAAALDRVGSDGVAEWHSAWWLALLSRHKRTGKTLAKCLPQLAGNGWQQALASGPALAARNGHTVSLMHGMARQCVDLAGHLAARGMGEDAKLLAFPDKALGGEGVEPGDVEAVDLAMGVAAGLVEQAQLPCFSPLMSIPLDWVRTHVRAYPKDPNGAPRHGLLDACLRGWAQAAGGSSDATVAQSTLEEIIDALLQSGAAAQLDTLAKVEACGQEGAVELHARALEACLGVRLGQGGGKRALRM